MRQVRLYPARVLAAAVIPTTFDYYISPTGSDSNDGLTTSTPWAITAINSKQATYAGKTIGFMDGTYNIYSMYATGSNDGYTPLLLIKGGSSNSARTVLKAVNRGQAIIQGNSGSSYGNNTPMLGDHNASQMGNITIDGLKFTGYASKCLYFGYYIAYTDSTRYHNYTVQNCEFTGQDARSLSYGNNLSSIEFAQCENGLVANNYLHDNIGYNLASGGAVGDGTGFDHFSGMVQWISQNMIYEYNTVYSSGNIYGKEQRNYGTTIRYNYVDSSMYVGSANAAAVSDFGGDSVGGTASAIHHNVFIAPKPCDLRPSLGGDTWPDAIAIYNNTLIVTNSGQSLGLCARTQAGKLSAYNNIIYSSATGDMDYICANTQAPGLIDYNLYYTTTATSVWASFSTTTDNTRNGTTNFGTWKTTMGGVEANAVNGSDPLFVASGSNADYYVLQAGSPAKNAGKSNGTSGGTTCDMGTWGNSPPARIGYLATA